MNQSSSLTDSLW